jgi:Skp family chaperone for outer membrane proteins
MNKVIISVVLLVSLGNVQGAAAPAVAHHPHAHSHVVDIVVVNVMEVFQALQEVKEWMQDFQNNLMKKVEQIRAMEQQGIEREKALSIKSKNLTSEAREKERMEIERLKNEIRIQAQSLEEKQQEEQMLLQQRIGEKIKDYCKKMEWKIVIPGALYAAPEHDKTQQVIDGMNKDYAKAKEAKKTAKAVEKARS